MPYAGGESGSWVVFPVIVPILFPIVFPMLFMMFMMRSRFGPFGMMFGRGRPDQGPGGPFGMSGHDRSASGSGGASGMTPSGRPSGDNESPLETAQRRYAAGEISREEFQRIREDLGTS